jgi:hypothetical protein
MLLRRREYHISEYDWTQPDKGDKFQHECTREFSPEVVAEASLVDAADIAGAAFAL